MVNSIKSSLFFVLCPLMCCLPVFNYHLRIVLKSKIFSGIFSVPIQIMLLSNLLLSLVQMEIFSMFNFQKPPSAAAVLPETASIMFKITECLSCPLYPFLTNQYKFWTNSFFMSPVISLIFCIAAIRWLFFSFSSWEM